ncbi:hypothetical protein BST33_14015 [Mycolicibacter minnesotensis]|uniref:Uncharacterized protein n=1 Tax=Mycolicibacter minnesotensis TaxID=1118379 RepID=A0A7I7R704_9MYCO|nr:DUF5994 family protein [Mycolicibacter minnesotensis]ORA99573.1 hypothetical protein BST33_14015 [Mycolicibacter minnesotensis]BBY34428.1 hypothetical protein MMIN_24890 [Mycolicibacter minnesotensis]
MTRQQTTRKSPDNSTSPLRTPRLRLKRKDSPSGYVDGAWWPHTDDLVVELPDLLAVLSVRLGRISRVLYNLNEWICAPKKLVIDGRPVRLDGYRIQPIDTVEVLGLDGDRLTLMVVPARTGPSDAHAAMMTAAQPKNAVSVSDLLTASPRERERRNLAATALDRWESEGGTMPTPASAAPRQPANPATALAG